MVSLLHGTDGSWYVSALELGRLRNLADGSGVTVAVVDSGVERTHPVLQGRVLSGADFSEDETRSTGDGRVDVNGHGTGMASLIAGHGSVEGVAPAASILPVRVTSGDGVLADVSAVAVAAGIRWAVDRGADVINLSLSSAVADPRERMAIEYARAHGVVIVAAAGSSELSVAGVQYPAREAGVVAVCATTDEGAKSYISVEGPELTVCAPGESIRRAGKGTSIVVATGTSDSAAIVSGVVALILQHHPNLDPDAVIQLLATTADDKGPAGRDDLYGYGIVNPLRAITAAVPSMAPSPSVIKSSKASSDAQSPSGQTKLALTTLLILIGLLGATVVMLRRVRARTGR